MKSDLLTDERRSYIFIFVRCMFDGFFLILSLIFRHAVWRYVRLYTCVYCTLFTCRFQTMTTLSFSRFFSLFFVVVHLSHLCFPVRLSFLFIIFVVNELCIRPSTMFALWYTYIGSIILNKQRLITSTR